MNEQQGSPARLNLARLGLILALAVIALWAWPAAEAHADDPFATSYGGTDIEYAYAVQQTTDGGYVVAGHTISFGVGNYDVWVLKLNADGSVAWQKTHGGANYDFAYAIQQTNDGGYIVAGETWSVGAGISDVWVLRLDANGNIVWQKAYGGINEDTARAVQQTADGGYVVAGYTTSFGTGDEDAWVLKLDADGNVAWQKTYGGGSYDSASAVQQTTDGGYVVGGRTWSFGTSTADVWILKLDANGDVDWQKTYGPSETALAIQQTADGGYVVVGYTWFFGVGSWDAWVLKLSADGSVVWEKTYGGTDYEYANVIQQTGDGGYAVAGWTSSFGAGNNDAWVLKLNADGNVAWQKTYGGVDGDEVYTLQQTGDGGYMVAGYTESFGSGNYDVWVLKLDAEGSLCAGCPLGEPSTATLIDSSAIVTDSTAIPVDSTATVADSSATVNDTNVIPDPICVCSLEPDLSITKAVTPNVDVPYHGTVTYTVALANSGPGNDPDVSLTDTLPVEVDFGRWVEQPAGAEIVDDELTWQGTVTAEEIITFTFVVSHVGAYGDTVTNIAEFSGTQQAGEDGAAFTVVESQPALSIAKDVIPTEDVPYHGVVTYTLVLANAGPGNDPDVSLTDTLPIEVDFGRWVEQPAGAEVADDELTWQGTVTAGQAITFTFVVSHVGDYGDTVTNIAEFSGTLQTGEDSATFTVMEPEPALSITKDATPTDNTPYHGTVTYTVMLVNDGAGSDPNVLLTDTLPTEVDFVRWVPGGQPAGAEVIADELTWQGTVTPGQSITFTFVVSHVGDYGDTVTNTACFSGTLQAGGDSATFTVAGQAMYTVYLPLVIRNH